MVFAFVIADFGNGAILEEFANLTAEGALVVESLQTKTTISWPSLVSLHLKSPLLGCHHLKEAVMPL